MTSHTFSEGRHSAEASIVQAGFGQFTARKFSSSAWIRAASQFALAVGMLASTFQPTHAAGLDKVRVENFTGFNDLGDHLAKELTPELKEVMSKRKLAVFAIATAFPGKKACFAAIGLTEAQPDNRNPRIPSQMFSSFATKTDKDWNESTCQSEQLRTVIWTSPALIDTC